MSESLDRNSERKSVDPKEKERYKFVHLGRITSPLWLLVRVPAYYFHANV